MGVSDSLFRNFLQGIARLSCLVTHDRSLLLQSFYSLQISPQWLLQSKLQTKFIESFLHHHSNSAPISFTYWYDKNHSFILKSNLFLRPQRSYLFLPELNLVYMCFGFWFPGAFLQQQHHKCTLHDIWAFFCCDLVQVHKKKRQTSFSHHLKSDQDKSSFSIISYMKSQLCESPLFQQNDMI